MFHKNFYNNNINCYIQVTRKDKKYVLVFINYLYKERSVFILLCPLKTKTLFDLEYQCLNQTGLNLLTIT